MSGNPWLHRPHLELAGAKLAEFEAAYRRLVALGGGWLSAPTPIWAFLCWLADEKGLLLHGSPDPAIDAFEPRAPHDRSADDFSKQTAVFAASDGIWAIFYAVLDRDRPGMRFLNGAVRFADAEGRFGQARYFFSLTRGALAKGPWRDGTVYLLPRDGFVQQAPYRLGGELVLEPHWAAPSEVRPLARVAVSPEDFPLRSQVREHEPARVDAAAARDPEGFPWL